MTNLGVGIIGCGNISAAYLRLAPNFNGIQVLAVVDLDHDVAVARAEEFGVRADSVDRLLASDDIDIVANLTPPNAHFAVTKQILLAGKHAYSEKPLVLTLAEGNELAAFAAANQLRIGSAPDTFLGGTHQNARAVLDSGAIGNVIAGSCHVMSHGMEHWHPNPDFFFLPGAGPILDMGPYYITNLIQLIGPVKRVVSLASSATPTRTILSEPRKGEVIPVKSPTNIHALVEFEQGATITLSASWDIWAHRHTHMELCPLDQRRKHRRPPGSRCPGQMRWCQAPGRSSLPAPPNMSCVRLCAIYPPAFLRTGSMLNVQAGPVQPGDLC